MKVKRYCSVRTLFLCAVTVLPLIVVQGSIRSFAEPKLAVLLFLSSICLIDLYRRFAPSGELAISALQVGMSFLLLLELPAMLAVGNPGLMLTSLTLQLSLLIISLWVLNTELSLLWLTRAVMVSVFVVAVGALAMSLYRIPLFSNYAPFGSTIGLKNSVAVFLAQAVPFLLVNLVLTCELPARRRAERAIGVILLVVSLWIVFAYRTRSAWWMILFYLIALLLLAQRKRTQPWRSLFRVTFVSALAAAALCYLVPGQLRWRSDTPYLDSVMTLASFEHSSGRDKLWRVALEIIGAHPWGGLGLGNYPATWPAYLPLTDIDPKSFAFLRPDLPLFNEYLQNGVECGIAAMVLFAFTLFGLPAGDFLRRLRHADQSEYALALLSLCCLSTALDAFLDAPFSRPEGILLFAVAAGISSRDGGWRYQPAARPLFHVALATLLLVVGFVGVRVTGSTIFRRQFLQTHDPRTLELAWRLWPWSAEWNSSHAAALQQTMDPVAFARLAQERRAAWPNDPESYLLLAKGAEAQRSVDEAFALYRRGIVTVPGGRCYPRGIANYDRFIQTFGLVSDPRRLSDAELSVCRVRG